jgi:hypothetical protein
MGLGSWFKSIGHALGGGSSYDEKGSQSNVNTYKTNLGNLNSQSQQTATGLNSYSHQLAGQNYMAGAQNAYQQQLANYGQQQGAASMLYNQATGQTASPADIQMQSGLANANNQAQSAAYSQQGGVSPGLTQRNMLNSQAQTNASIVNQGAAMRAQETQAAQQNYASMLGQMGQTAAGMTNQQQNMGQFQYGQGQNDLSFQSQQAAQDLAYRQANASSGYAAQNNYYNAQAGYQSQQDTRAMNTFGAAFGSLAGGGGGK